MKKVLIICDLFPPAFGPRMGYLCKYLQHYGWQAEVVTESVNENTFAFLQHECPITYVNYYTAKNPFLKKLQWITIWLLDLIFGYKDFFMFRKANKICQKSKFELVLCSSFRTFPLPAALQVAQKNNLPLIVDLRDIIEQYTENEYMAHFIKTIPVIDRIITAVYKRKLLKSRNQVLKKATHITTVSPWHVKILQQYNPHISLIYNGFDPELFYPDPHTNQKFTITYTGRIISLAMRNPELLFKGILASGLSSQEINIEWYVDPASKSILKELADELKVSDYMTYKNYVPASEVPQLLNNSSILLIITEKSTQDGPKGIMTTKFFEALAVKKPILCIPSDEGCLEEVILKTASGIAAHNENEVAEFIRFYYQQWKTSGYTQTTPNTQEVQRFSRKQQAGQFVQLFQSLNSNQ